MLIPLPACLLLTRKVESGATWTGIVDRSALPWLLPEFLETAGLHRFENAAFGGRSGVRRRGGCRGFGRRGGAGGGPGLRDGFAAVQTFSHADLPRRSAAVDDN